MPPGLHHVMAAAHFTSCIGQSFACNVESLVCPGSIALVHHRVQVSARTRLLWTLATALPAVLSVATFGTLPIFVMEHISLSGRGAGPLGSAAADVAVGCLFGLAVTIIFGHLRVVLAHAVWPRIWVGSHGSPKDASISCHTPAHLCGRSC